MCEKRSISAGSTGFFRILAPAVGGVVFLFYALSRDFGRVDHFEWAVLFALGGFVAALWMSRKLRHVAADDDYLYVAGASGEIRVPYSDIEKITWREGRNSTVRVKLKTAYDFGSTFYFIPPSADAQEIVRVLREKSSIAE